MKKITETISNEFRRHKYLIDSDVLDAKQKNDFQKIIEGVF